MSQEQESVVYLKQLIVDGDGKFQVIKVKASSRDGYLADDWQDSSEEEFLQQFRDRTATVDSKADKALGEKADEQAEGEANTENQTEEKADEKMDAES